MYPWNKLSWIIDELCFVYGPSIGVLACVSLGPRLCVIIEPYIFKVSFLKEHACLFISTFFG